MTPTTGLGSPAAQGDAPGAYAAGPPGDDEPVRLRKNGAPVGAPRSRKSRVRRRYSSRAKVALIRLQVLGSTGTTTHVQLVAVLPAKLVGDGEPRVKPPE